MILRILRSVSDNPLSITRHADAKAGSGRQRKFVRTRDGKLLDLPLVFARAAGTVDLDADLICGLMPQIVSRLAECREGLGPYP